MTPLDIQIQSNTVESKSEATVEVKNVPIKAVKLSRITKGIIIVTLLLTLIGSLVYWYTNSLAIGVLCSVVPYFSYKIGKWISYILKQDYDFSKPMF